MCGLRETEKAEVERAIAKIKWGEAAGIDGLIPQKTKSG